MALAFWRQDAEVLTEFGELRCPGLIRAQASVQKDKGLAFSLFVVPRLQLADRDVLTTLKSWVISRDSLLPAHRENSVASAASRSYQGSAL
jgi:hypothetical protein